uniref:Uncharacterized protein n=1 Tax=Trichogramma kaykai TaxID=54128 RepID=A0ABD2WY61_9HYME
MKSLRLPGEHETSDVCQSLNSPRTSTTAENARLRPALPTALFLLFDNDGDECGIVQCSQGAASRLAPVVTA